VIIAQVYSPLNVMAVRLTVWVKNVGVMGVVALVARVLSGCLVMLQGSVVLAVHPTVRLRNVETTDVVGPVERVPSGWIVRCAVNVCPIANQIVSGKHAVVMVVAVRAAHASLVKLAII